MRVGVGFPSFWSSSGVPVEGLDVGVLPGCAWFDVAGLDACEAAPVAEGVGDEFGAVVAADQLGCLAAAFDDPLKRLDRVIRAEAARCSGGQRLAGVLIGDGEDLDRSAVGGLVDEEVERPHLVRAGGGDVTGHPLAPAPSPRPWRQPQALVPPQPLHPLAVTRPALST